MITVKGKLSKDFRCDICMQEQDEGKEAAIELSPPNISEIKEGDWILAKVKVLHNHKIYLITTNDPDAEDVVYHFPQQPKPEINNKDGCCYKCGQKWTNHTPEKCKPKQESCKCEIPEGYIPLVINGIHFTCGKPIRPEFKKEINFGKEFYEIQPSKDSVTGTQGRTAVAEVFEMDKQIEAAVLRNATEPELYKVLRQKGMLSMKEDAIIKAFDRVVPFEEVNAL